MNETGNQTSICAEAVPTFFGSIRPKIWLRRAPTRTHLAIKEYILNRGTQAEAASLENLNRTMRGG